MLTIIAIALGIIWLALATWFIGAFLAWSGPSEEEAQSELGPFVPLEGEIQHEPVGHVRARSDVA